jgi:hypothetical protein
MGRVSAAVSRLARGSPHGAVCPAQLRQRTPPLASDEARSGLVAAHTNFRRRFALSGYRADRYQRGGCDAAGVT